MQIRATLLIIAATISTAHAQGACPTQASVALEPPSMVCPREAPRPTVTEWYGWQILASDAALLSLAAAAKNGRLIYGWVGSGAAVHFAHGNVGRGLASAALRIGLPYLGAYLGSRSAGGCGGDWCGFGEGLLGGLLGAASAEVLDAALLGRQDRPAPAIAPLISADDSSVRVGLAGRF